MPTSSVSSGAELRLSDLPVGSISVLSRVSTSRSRRRRLAELGFVAGATIEVLGRGGVNGLLLAVNADTRVAVDATGAGELWVEGGRHV